MLHSPKTSEELTFVKAELQKQQPLSCWPASLRNDPSICCLQQGGNTSSAPHLDNIRTLPLI